MHFLGLWRLITLMSCVVIFVSQFPIPSFGGSKEHPQIKTSLLRQIAVPPTSASSLVFEPASVGFPFASTLDSSTPEQTGEAQVATDSPNDDAPKNNNDEPRRRALTAPLDGVFPSSEYLGPTPLVGVPDTDPIHPLTKAFWSAFPVLKRARIDGMKLFGVLDLETQMEGCRFSIGIRNSHDKSLRLGLTAGQVIAS